MKSKHGSRGICPTRWGRNEGSPTARERRVMDPLQYTIRKREKCSGSRGRGYLRSLLLLCGRVGWVGGWAQFKRDAIKSIHTQTHSRSYSTERPGWKGDIDARGRKWRNMKVDLSREPFDNNASTRCESQAIRTHPPSHPPTSFWNGIIKKKGHLDRTKQFTQS